eukprot:923845-Amphidinium_carterae.1
MEAHGDEAFVGLLWALCFPKELQMAAVCAPSSTASAGCCGFCVWGEEPVDDVEPQEQANRFTWVTDFLSVVHFDP